MMVNNAGDVFKLCISTKGKQKLYNLNTLTDVPYEMMVGGAFIYVCERDRVKEFVYITRSVIMELKCTLFSKYLQGEITFL